MKKISYLLLSIFFFILGPQSTNARVVDKNFRVILDASAIIADMRLAEVGSPRPPWCSSISEAMSEGGNLEVFAIDEAQVTTNLLSRSDFNSGINADRLSGFLHTNRTRDEQGNVYLKAKGNLKIARSDYVPLDPLSRSIKDLIKLDNPVLMLQCSPLIRWKEVSNGTELVSCDGLIPSPSFFNVKYPDFPLSNGMLYPKAKGQVYWIFRPEQLSQGLGESADNPGRKSHFKNQLRRMWATYFALRGLELAYFDDLAPKSLSISNKESNPDMENHTPWPLEILQSDIERRLIPAWELSAVIETKSSLQPMPASYAGEIPSNRLVEQLTVSWHDPCIIYLSCDVKENGESHYVQMLTAPKDSFGLHFSMDKPSAYSLSQTISFNPPRSLADISVLASQYMGEKMLFPAQFDVAVRFKGAISVETRNYSFGTTTSGGWPAYRNSPADAVWDRGNSAAVRLLPQLERLEGAETRKGNLENDFLVNLYGHDTNDSGQKEQLMDQLVMQLAQLAGIPIPTMIEIPDFRKRLEARIAKLIPVLGKRPEELFALEKADPEGWSGRFRPLAPERLPALSKGFDSITNVQQIAPGKDATFAFFRVSNDHFWAEGSAETVEADGKTVSIEELFNEKLNNARVATTLETLDGLICVGMASKRGDIDRNSDLSRRRTAKLVQLCGKIRSTSPKSSFDTFGVFRGAYIGTSQDSPSQRAVLLVGVRYDRATISTVDLRRAFELSLQEVGKLGSLWQEFERDYKEFSWGMEENGIFRPMK